MSYEHDLSFQLRLRGLKEADIADVVAEVRDHAASGGEMPETEFGTPEEYAASFPAPTTKRRRSAGARLTTVTTLLAASYLIVMLALKVFMDFDMREIVGPVSLWPAGVLVVSGLLVGFLVDYLRPTPKDTQR